MGIRGTHSPPPRETGSLARVLAIPVAVLLAGLGCVAMLLALASVPLPHARVVAVEEQAEPGAAREPEPGTGHGPDREPPGTEPGRGDPPAGEDGTGEGGTGTAQQPVPPESYNGASAEFDTFLVEVEKAYTDTTVTDGMGSSDTAPSGMEFHVYRLHVTNQGTGPAVFDTYGTTGLTTDGLEYANDIDAEITVAWDYFWDDINPGETVTTHILFLAPVGTEFAEVRIAGRTPLEPN
ncbi:MULTISPECIES: DUF4352 domain-containing protein [Nocardiopsis]|uniref:DUF4352 domain-containing protein n=1 Tax=Nocardiopsis sinuspersici TaxID=501010 RepID=A0A1V3C4T2_9ACTN|nr:MULTISPECIES: DUF4352 domain-containing protein [Nocardiopsis]OOC55787.1 hypothetical protein NOSIN_19750 [Nocardiopsis sinuspersici]